MIITAIRTVIIYIFIIAAIRIMGKRQLGELQPAEVVTLLISDLAAVPMQESGMPLLDGVIPILVLVAMELLFSGLMLKVPFFYRLISGRPMVVIDNGKLDQQALKRMRVTIGDLVESLREQNVFDIEQIQYAIAETNGKISVLLKPEYRQPSCGDLNAVPPDTGVSMIVVDDGRVSEWALSLCGLDRQWLEKTLKSQHCRIEDVFLMMADRSKKYTLIRKEQFQKARRSAG